MLSAFIHAPTATGGISLTKNENDMKYETIKPYIEKGLISEQRHPEDNDVAIFNYTQKCQFDREWDEVTLNCRGLIMRISTGEIMARPFPKFFNYQEHVEKCKPMPSEIPLIMEKLDGSLGIMYTLKDKTWIATRGSFVSDQAIWATNWWRENKGDEPYGNDITYLFEIIYPQNRIVVNYDYSGLVHLASLDTKTGKPVKSIMPVRAVKMFEWLPTVKLLQMDEPNSEGFVLYYPEADLRLKIKFPEYVRLHKLVTGLSEIAIWEHLRDGNVVDDLLTKVPDEFFKWVQKVENDLRARFAAIWGRAQHQRLMCGGANSTRKEQALYIMEHAKDISGVVFSLLDGEDKKAVQQVWKMLRPHGRSSFKVDIDS